MRVSATCRQYAVLLVLALGAAPVQGAAPRPGDLVVAGGTIVLSIDPRTGNQNLVSSDSKSLAAGGAALFAGGELFGGIGIEADGDIVVLQRRGDYDAPNSDPARLIRIDPATGAHSLIQGSDDRLTYSQLALVIGPQGQIYFSSENTNPGSAIWKADPSSGAITLVSNAELSAAAGGFDRPGAPMSLWVDADGTLWALNEFSDIVRIEPATGKMTVFSSNALSVRSGGQALSVAPRAITRAPNGDFYFVDDPAINDHPHYGARDARVIRVDHASGAATLVSDNARSVASGGRALMHRPIAIAMEPDGQLVLSDGSALRVIRVDPVTGAQSLVSSSGSLDNPTALAVVPGTPPPRARTLQVTTAGVAAGRVQGTGNIDCGRAAQTDVNLADPGSPNLPQTSSVTCQRGYAAGTVVTLTALPETGSTFAGFSGGGCSGSAPSCEVTMDQSHAVLATFLGRTLTVVPAGTGAGYVSSFQPGLDCGRNLDPENRCVVDFANGQVVQLSGTAYPATNTFAGFSGAGCSGTAPCDVTMNADRTVTATFNGTAPRRNLTVTTAGAGAGFVTGSPQGIDCGRNVTGHDACTASIGPDGYAENKLYVLTAFAAPGQRFVGFSGGGCSGPDPCQLAMTANRAVTATFETDGPVQRALTVTTGGGGSGFVDSAPAGVDCGRPPAGRVRCASDFDDGTRVVLAAHPAPGMGVLKLAGGPCVGRALTCELTMTEAQGVTARFGPTVAFSRRRQSVGEGASGSVDVVLGAASRTTVSVTITLAGTATAGSDYAAPATTLSFEPGVVRQSLIVATSDDAAAEADEIAELRITQPIGAVVVAPPVFALTIVDND